MGQRMFEIGARVQTPYGAGVVKYRRMGPPCYDEPEAYSVKLDGKDHEGTIVRAELVAPYHPEAECGSERPAEGWCYCSDRMSGGLPCPPGRCPNVPQVVMAGGEP